MEAAAPVTVDGHKVAFGISWFTPGYPSLDVYLAMGGARNTQAHFWEFQPPASDFSFNGKAATLKVTEGKVAYADLAFTTTRTVKCSGGSTNYYGTLKGELELVTGLAKAGTVGSRSVPLDFSEYTPEISELGTCALKTSCSGSISWNLLPPGTLSPSADGFFVGAPIGNVVELNRTVTLSAPYPKGSSRVDSAQVEEAAPPTYDSKTHVLSVVLPGHIKGAATISPAAVETSTSTCQAPDGRSYTMTFTSTTAPARWKSTVPVSANVVLTGRLTLPTQGKGATFDIVTSKAS